MNTDYTPKINLLDYKNAEQRQRKQRRMEILLYALVLLLVAGALAGVGYYQHTRLAELTALNEQLTLERQQVAAQVTPASKVYVADAERQKTLDQLLEKRISYIEPLKNVYWQAEPNIYLNRWRLMRKSLYQRLCAGPGGLHRFQPAHAGSPRVKAVKSVDSRLNEKNGEVTFSLVFDWEVKP